MEIGFTVEAAKSKKPAANTDAPNQVPMRPRKPAQQAPSTDQKRARRQMARQAVLSPEDAAFLYQHALDYAKGDVNYAAWYMATYGGEADSLGDVPDHPDAMAEYQKVAAEAAPEDTDADSPADSSSNPFPPKKESSMTTEADLLAKMAAASTLAEQSRYALELSSLRTARIQQQREAASLDLANTLVQERYPLMPTAPTQMGVTASSDWLGTIEPDERPTPQVEATMRAEASIWYNGRPAEVKADLDEITAQAVGYGRRVASGYGLQAEAAFQAFSAAVDHLHTTSTRRLALDVVQPSPYQYPAAGQDKPVTNEDTFDDDLNTPVMDEKNKNDSPSLSEGGPVAGDSAPGGNTNPATKSTHAEDDKDTNYTDYLDGTTTPNSQGGKETFSSRKQSDSVDNRSSDQHTVPSMDQGGPVASDDGVQPYAKDAPTSPEGLDQSQGDGTTTDYLDGSTYPKQGSLRTLAARIEADEAQVGRQVHPNARPFLAAMHQVDSVKDSFGGISGAQIVEHFLRQAVLGGPNAQAHVHALNDHLAGKVAGQEEGMKVADSKKTSSLKTVIAGDTIQVSSKPPCDVCKMQGNNSPAEYDSRLPGLGGSWGNVCQRHFDAHGPGQTGTGHAQKYVTATASKTAGEVPEAFKKQWNKDSDDDSDGDSSESGDESKGPKAFDHKDSDSDASESGDDSKDDDEDMPEFIKKKIQDSKAAAKNSTLSAFAARVQAGLR